ncbi:TF1-like protein, partial [Selaginella moellendorffii]
MALAGFVYCLTCLIVLLSSPGVAIDPFETVIPDWVDSFHFPRPSLRVAYGSQNVTIEREFLPAEVLLQPKVSITNAGNRDLFTLVMVDPDPPGPQIPILRNILHWIVVNIPAQSTNVSEQGDHLAPYLSPTPVQGVHCYYFLLFRQKQIHAGSLSGSLSRTLFSVRVFTEKYDLGYPVDGVFFTSR